MQARRFLGLAIAGLAAILVLGALLPQPRTASASTYTAVAVGANHSCALASGGGVQCWGRNVEGQVGDGTFTSRAKAVVVSGLTSGVTAIGEGGFHSCAVISGGGLKCWGANENGQVGDGTTTNRNAPVTVCASGSGGSCVALTGIAAVAGGDAHTCALTTGGGVKCWGRNQYGQLGNGTTTDSVAPVDVSGLSSGVAALAAGESHMCALTTAGGMKCWPG